MTVVRFNALRLLELTISACLCFRRFHVRAEFENLSDRSLDDIGLKPPRRDLDTVKPFWMP